MYAARAFCWQSSLGRATQNLSYRIPDFGQVDAFVQAQLRESYLSGPHVSALGYEVVRLLTGRIPRPIAKAAGLWTPGPAVFAFLLIMQVLAALHTLCFSRPWNRTRHRRSWGWLQPVWHAVLSPITSLGLAILLLVILPSVTAMPLSGLRLFGPDAGLLIVTNATLA